MSNNIAQLIEQLSANPFDPQINLNLGAQYEALGQTATAVSFYLRTAEFGYEKNPEIAYCALLRVGLCLGSQGNRNWNVTNNFLQALHLIPERPEAYYLLSRYYEDQGAWQEAYTFADLGLRSANVYGNNLQIYMGYDGVTSLMLQKAISAWSIGRASESIEYFQELGATKNLPPRVFESVLNNFKNLNIPLEKIAIILPVRDGGTGRSQRLIKCLNSWAKMNEGYSDVHIILDEDDIDNFTYLFEHSSKFNVYVRPAHYTLMEKINSVAMDVAHIYKYLMFVGDDIEFKTKWEIKFIEHLLTVPAGLVYGETLDLPEGVDWATHPCITSNLVKAVGFYGCPAVAHNFFDNFWSDVAKDIGHFTKLSDVVMDHRRLGWKPDEIYHKIVELRKSDAEKYAKYKKTKYQEDLDKIKKALNV